MLALGLVKNRVVAGDEYYVRLLPWQHVRNWERPAQAQRIRWSASSKSWIKMQLHLGNIYIRTALRRSITGHGFIASYTVQAQGSEMCHGLQFSLAFIIWSSSLFVTAGPSCAAGTCYPISQLYKANTVATEPCVWWFRHLDHFVWRCWMLTSWMRYVHRISDLARRLDRETGKSKPIKTHEWNKSIPCWRLNFCVSDIGCYDTSRQLTYFIPNFWQFLGLQYRGSGLSDVV